MDREEAYWAGLRPEDFQDECGVAPIPDPELERLEGLERLEALRAHAPATPWDRDVGGVYQADPPDDVKTDHIFRCYSNSPAAIYVEALVNAAPGLFARIREQERRLDNFQNEIDEVFEDFISLDNPGRTSAIHPKGLLYGALKFEFNKRELDIHARLQARIAELEKCAWGDHDWRPMESQSEGAVVCTRCKVPGDARSTPVYYPAT